jgi:hypothetical protein
MVFISFTALRLRGKINLRDECVTWTPLRVRKEHYLEATHPFGDGFTPSKLARSLGVKPSNALKMVREPEAEDL